ncbi:DUF1919 domain-containing protein [Anaeromassilibacillus senegalensis]|uniref:DUF1919 domain-containing protein n=1 Tax=Anaeromassilibacillus senegalensis TaxID=1673717 RepID=A0ABS9CRC0_9FIRM|nr:DUF1919 domain-containing protein [Anaeromassilibacillus senegalensis]MCF2652697.1 DUF1919 domain-containing protein [Anaeromassilibacillus senegalensis]
MEPKVSIIVPVYKAEKALRKCVESLVFGAYHNLEVILVEDCSPDGSWAQCQILAEEFPAVRCVRNEKNSGVSHTRNRGIALASGEYICFVDSDDWASGKYVSRLIEASTDHEDALIICGFRFHEEVAGYTADYLWDPSGNPLIPIHADQFFALQEKVLLQSPCNKAFQRRIILENSLAFDETQTMGEDFQFVLDYMEAACVRQCVIVNEPLYHYVRANNTSLMSKFGLVERENEFHRLDQLRRISGDTAGIAAQYSRAVEALKKNYVYQTMHNPALDKARKIRYIQDVLEVGDGTQIYQQYRLLLFKEQLAQCLTSLKRLPSRVSGRLQRERQAWFIHRLRRQFTASEPISIIAQNCIGGVLYHDLGLEFSSPTVNLFFRGPDFIRFVSNLKHYMELEPVMTWGENYPIGYLEDVQIHFMHYATCSEARDAWNRRKCRINWDRIAVLCTDMEDFTDEVFARWKDVPYPKVLFTANSSFAQHQDSVFYPEDQPAGRVGDLISGRKFYRDGRVMAMLNHTDEEKNGWASNKG